MAITSKGFAGGPMTDDDFGAIAARGGWVENAGDYAVTQPNAGTRSVAVAAGTAVGHGVRAINDAAISQALTAPGSGGQWYLLVLRRDWTAGVKTTTLQVLSGASTGTTTAPTDAPAALPATFQNAVGTAQGDQGLAWAFVNSANTTVTLFDVRFRLVARQLLATTLQALLLLALHTTLVTGVQLGSLADGFTYRWNGTKFVIWSGSADPGLNTSSVSNLGTGRETELTREGRTVTFSLMVNAPGSLATNSQIATLPDGFRPPREKHFTVAVYNGSNQNAFSGFADFQIDTTGAVTLKYSPSGSGSGSQYLGSTSFTAAL